MMRLSKILEDPVRFLVSDSDAGTREKKIISLFQFQKDAGIDALLYNIIHKSHQRRFQGARPFLVITAERVRAPD